MTLTAIQFKTIANEGGGIVTSLYKRLEAARLLRLETVREACVTIGIAHGTWANIQAGKTVSGLTRAKAERYIATAFRRHKTVEEQ